MEDDAVAVGTISRLLHCCSIIDCSAVLGNLGFERSGKGLLLFLLEVVQVTTAEVGTDIKDDCTIDGVDPKTESSSSETWFASLSLGERSCCCKRLLASWCTLRACTRLGA